MNKLSIFLLVCLFSISLVSAIELNPFAVTKIVEKNVKEDMSDFLKADFNPEYGVIRLSKTIFWIPTDRVAEYSLTSNTERCYLNCEAKGKAVLYTDGSLFEDINFKDKRNNLYEMDKYQFWLFNGYETKIRDICLKYDESTGSKGEEFIVEQQCLEYGKEEYQEEIWLPYKYETLKAGDYQWKLTGSKKSMEDSVDWLATSNGKVLTEWAYWLEGSAKYVYVGGATNKTVQKFLVDDASLLATSGDYGGTIYSISLDDTYVYYGGQTTEKVYRAYKTNLSNSISSASYGGIIRSITVDDTYVYYGGDITQKVYRAYKTNLSNSISSASYGGSIYSMTVDDTYVYYGGATTTKVYRAYKTNLSNNISSASYGGYISSIEVDDTYVYYGGQTTNKVYKAYKTNLSKIQETASYGGTILDIKLDDTYVYYGGATTNKVYRAYKTNLSNSISSASYGGTIRSITVDDTYVYYGGDTTNKVYRAYKTNLSNSISSASYGGAIYDLQIELSSVPIITLNSPADISLLSSTSVTFNATVTSTIGITNVSLYLNGVLNTTNSSGINASDYLFTKTLTEGNHNWTIKSCNDDGCATSETRTFTIDTTAPVLSGVALNTSTVYTVGDQVRLNFTATDTHLSTCWYEYNGANTTVTGCQSGVQNQTDITTVAGKTEIKVWANDTFGWNSTASSVSFVYDTFAPNITINYPTPIVDYERIATNLQLNITFTDGNLDKCWYNYNGTNISLPGCQSGIYNVSNINLTTKKNITIYANDTAQNLNTTFFSWDYKVFENSRTFDASTFDTATANYGVNITANSSLTGVVLYYNGSSYAMNDQGSGIWNISRQLPSSVIGTQNFSYRFQYAGDTIQGENSTQTVAETIFALCNGTYTTRFLNVTFADENSLSAINASIPTSSWGYYLGNGTVNKTLTYSNASDNYNYSFCGTSGGLPLKVYPTVQYKQGTAYPQRIWIPSIQTYNSTMTTQVLYLLGSTDGLYVTFQVIDSSDATISGVEVNVSRVISGSTVQISSGTTDSGGLVTFWLNPDFQHTITFTKSGYTTYTTSLFPTQSSYTVTLGGTGTVTTDKTTGISYGIKPTDSFLTYFTVHDFEFSLGSTYWGLDEFGFDLNWSNGTLIGSNSSTTSSGGTISIQDFNVSNGSAIVMTPYYTIDSVKYTLQPRFWYLQSSEGREFSLYQWFGDFTTYTSTGTSVLGFNDFGKLLLTALVLILLVGGLSQRYGLQSESAITGIIFSVIFFLEYTLEWIPLITTPLGTLPRGTITIVSAIILIATMIAGERR